MPHKKGESSLFEYYGFTKTDEKKYPVVSGILKELTPERIKEEIEKVQKVELPNELKKWIAEYQKVGDRNPFIWKWVYFSSQKITPPLSNKKIEEDLWKTKVLLFMFDTLIDDISDKKMNKELLEELLMIPFIDLRKGKISGNDKKYYDTTKKLWEYIIKKINNFPRYKEFESLFLFDIMQVFDAMRYSYLVNKNPYIVNKMEFWEHLSHNMMAMVCCSVDIMCSVNYKKEEIGKIREVFYYAQKMARIGNWVSTWEREIYEKDYTSGVLAYSMEKGMVDLREIEEETTIKKIKNEKIEADLLFEWEDCYKNIFKKNSVIKSINIKEFLKGMEQFITLHLSSRGYK